MTASTLQNSGRQWTQQQLEAIHTIDKSLLVSAAAGSGKTSVLAERCVHLLCDAEPACEVHELLVVTFTEAAAAEMKSRIARSLAARHAADPSDVTARHLATLDRANIGTLHSFCSRVIRQNFHRLGIDPEFRILDGDEASLLKIDVVRELFEKHYDEVDAFEFRSMVDCYGDGKDDRLMKQVRTAYDTLCSVTDPVAWLNEARDRIDQAIDLPFSQSQLGQAYHQIVHRELSSILSECQSAAAAIKPLKHFDSYVKLLRELYGDIKNWLSIFDTQGIDALQQVTASYELPPLPRMASTLDGKELAKSRIDAVRRSVREGAWRKNLLFTAEQWKQGLAKTRPHVDVFLALVSEFSELYSLAKDEQRVVDFADLERLTLRSLKSDDAAQLIPSPLARQFHHQFKHVLVDEYQDINQVQDAILSLVSRERLSIMNKTPGNLFCVGDVKQSIYRFRLAEAQQFLDKRDSYRQPGGSGQVIDLQMNFRSRAPLLSAINSVFERLMTQAAADLDYDQSQKLIPGQMFSDFPNGFSGAPIELHLLPKDPGTGGSENTAGSATEIEADDEPLDRTEREAALLGEQILHLVGSGRSPARQVADGAGGQSRPLQFRDIVILLRSMRFKADQFAATLRGMGIPVHAESVTGYFEATEINDVLSLLHVLDNQRQDIPLAALLRSPLSQLEDAETNLARIRAAYGGTPPVPFHLAVQRYAEEQSDALSDFLRVFRARLEHWRQEVRQRPVAEMLWSIYDQTGYLAYVAGLHNGQQREANLIELHDRARQFGSFQRQGLARFLTFLEKLKQETDLGQASIASEAENVVRIMSVHRSKGQEFPVVLLPDLGKAINMQDCQGNILLDRVAGLGMQVVDEALQVRYPSLASTVVQQRLRQQTLAEELRVLYVAMTRAKEHLILVGTCAATMTEKWHQQWAGHEGPIPSEVVLAARTPLDWLGPVAAIAGEQLSIVLHDETRNSDAEKSEELGDQPISAPRPSAHLAVPLEIAHLKPLSPAPPMSFEAQAIIHQLGQHYPFQSIAGLAATASVTSLVKKNSVDSAVRVPSADASVLPSHSTDRVLPKPGFLEGRLPLDAAGIGTATHAVLEYFDFSRIGETDILELQIQHLVQTRRLSQELASAVDRPAVEWFLTSEIGLLLKTNHNRLKREVPVYYSNPSGATEVSRLTRDPLDQQMVRGRIDLLAPTDSGWMIIDYKTDRVSGPSLDERAALYGGQLNIYRDALRKIIGGGDISAVLIFLTPRVIRYVADPAAKD